MTNHLPLNKCKRLADLGMSQRVGKGDWVYWIAEDCGHSLRGRPLLVGVDIVELTLDRAGIDWVLIPDLKTIMEFAASLNSTWAILRESNTSKNWLVELYLDDSDSIECGIRWVNTDPVLAVYALIDKVGKV